MATTETTYSIGELADEFDLTHRSIRFYESKGLLDPRREGQSRIYSRKDRVQLILIQQGKRLGFSLEQIGEILELWDNTNTGGEKQLRLLLSRISERKADLDQQMKDIEAMQQRLSSAERRYQQALNQLLETQ